MSVSRALESLGRLVANLFLMVLGLAILLSFQIGGFISSIAVGALATELVGRGSVGVVVFFVTAFAFGLFLSIFVWPHVHPVVSACIKAIGGMTSR